MRAFLVIFGGLLAIVSIVLSVLYLCGKISNNIGIFIFIIALIMIEVGRKCF